MATGARRPLGAVNERAPQYGTPTRFLCTGKVWAHPNLHLNPHSRKSLMSIYCRARVGITGGSKNRAAPAANIRG